jgi:hypothetical protein
MWKKALIPALLSLAVVGTIAEPVFAQSRREVRRRAERLHRSGRLSDSHYRRTIDKLNQRGDRRWTRQVDNTLSKWSRPDSNNRRRNRNRRWRR